MQKWPSSWDSFLPLLPTVSNDHSRYWVHLRQLSHCRKHPSTRPQSSKRNSEVILKGKNLSPRGGCLRLTCQPPQLVNWACTFCYSTGCDIEEKKKNSKGKAGRMRDDKHCFATQGILIAQTPRCICINTLWLWICIHLPSPQQKGTNYCN